MPGCLQLWRDSIGANCKGASHNVTYDHWQEAPASAFSVCAKLSPSTHVCVAVAVQSTDITCNETTTLQALEALDADAQLALPRQLQPRHACSVALQAPLGLWCPAHLGIAAPQSSLQVQNQGAQTAAVSKAQSPPLCPPQQERAYSQNNSHQHVQPNLPMAPGAEIGTLPAPAQGSTAANLSQCQHQGGPNLSAGLCAIQPVHRQPQDSMVLDQEMHEHTVAHGADITNTSPPASNAKTSRVSRPEVSFQPSAQQPARAQRGMSHPFSGTGAQAGIGTPGGRPQQQLAEPGQAAQMGVLQSGSSEELARALANLTQMVSCARSDHAQDAYPGGARPAQPSQLNALLDPARTEQQLPCQSQPALHEQHTSPPLVNAEQQVPQHRVTDLRPDLNSITMTTPHCLSRAAQQVLVASGAGKAPSSSLAEQHMRVSDRQLSPLLGLQHPAQLQLNGAGIQRQVPQQPTMPVLAHDHHTGPERDSKRKRGSPQVHGVPQHPRQPSGLAEDSALPLKRAKLNGNPSQMEHTASATHLLQAQAEPHVADESPADISLGVAPPLVAGACHLHATLRCVSIQRSAICDCPEREIDA